jgi:molybdate transport system substrate-binding protein
VPIGAYARQVLANASQASGGPGPNFADDVLANLASNEANVRAVLAKVQLGEADAGIVYNTDAAVAGDDVKVIEIPEAYNVVATYPIVALKEAGNPAVAQAWIDFILSAESQAILAKHGFGGRS